MKSGSADTHDLAVAAKAQADKMKSMSDAADKIRQAAQDMVTQDQRIADNSQKAIEASNKRSAEVLKATIDASNQDQRAWVVVKGLQGVPELDQQWKPQMEFTNTGKTPAKKVKISCNFEVNISEDAMVFKRAAYGSQNTLIVPNQVPFCDLDISSVFGGKMTQEIVGGLTKKEVAVAIFGSVIYDDVFGKTHWLNFCRVARPDGKAWDDCKHGGNDTGDGDPPPN